MRIGHPALGLTALIAISLACGPAGSSLASPAPTSTSLPQQSTDAAPPPTEAAAESAQSSEDLPPASLEELLRAKIADEGWSEEEALLAGLRVLAGETGVAEAFGAVPFDGEGTGTVYQALYYLETGADPSAKAEMERLLGIIIPPIDRLLEYAVPEGSHSFRAPGLASAAASAAECAKIFEAGFPAGSNVVCLEYKEQDLGGYKGRVFYPNWWTPASPEWSYMESAHQAIAASWAVYSTFGEMRAIDLVFTVLGDKDHPTTLAVTPGVGGAQSCQIAVFPAAIQIDLAKNPLYSPQLPRGVFMQIIAHEMFHCFQTIQFPQHAWDNVNWIEVNDWWGESTAEYFSNLVYPTVNYEHRWAKPFSAESTDTSIFDMSYHNFGFFQHLGNPGGIGPDGILALIDSLPPKSLPLQREAMSKVPGLDDLWHSFVRAVVDDSLPDSDGSTIAFPDNSTDTVAVLSPGTYDLPSRDFVANRYRLALGGGLGFHIQVHEADARVLNGARPEAGGPWSSPIAIDRDTGCVQYAAVVTSGGAQAPPRTFRLNAGIDQTAAAGAGCDACVVGRWRMTHTSYMSMYNAVMSDAGEAAPFATGTKGDLFLDIQDDGTLDAEAAAFGVTAIGGIPDSQGDPLYTETTMSLDGTTVMDYMALNGDLVMQVVDQGIAAKFTFSLMGEEFEVPLGDAAGAGFGTGSPGTLQPFNYVCVANQNLTLAPLIHPELYKGNVWDFVWVGP